uniref:HMG box domain-containing protein n=1 Tax=Periophthalmus magnuspinnatus TaxID=409849 RepID=A0A3B4B7K2_9GOBI
FQFSGSGDNYLTIDGGGHPFLSAEHTFHTPSLGDEVFEIPPISLDPDSALNISDAVSHFETPGSRNLVSNMVVEANDPSFASTFFNSGSQGMAQHSLRAESHAEGSVLLSSSALVNICLHLYSSSPMTIDVQLGDMDPGLLGSGQLNTINPSELTLGLGDMGERSEMMPTTPSPAGSLQDEDMDDFKRGGGKPATLASPTAAKKGRRKKDPNEPQKPVSAYALFFRDTQAAIKGQNPNASFGEVSKIVASMWDSLAEEQKQVYKKKTEIAKKGYLKALAAYKANQLSQVWHVTLFCFLKYLLFSESTSLQGAGSPSPTALSSTEENAPNIILNTGSKPTATAQSPTITKIIIPKHMLQAGRQVVTVLPGGVRALQPTTLLVSGAARGPPPLQQMQNAPPPPRLQQMAPAPPRLQAKPSTTQGVSISAAPPPPLQIKIVPASVQSDTVELVSTTDEQGNPEDDDVTEVEPLEEDVMEVSAPIVSSKMVCLRAGCNNPAVDSEDWDKEYCSNECVATHCRDVFQAWCSIRSQSVAAVK